MAKGDIDKALHAAAERVIELGKQQGCMLATAESCTGGLIGAALTSIPGSSSVYDRGIISYTNEAKIKLLLVAPFILDVYGAVSAQTARAMVRGLLDQSDAGIGLSVTGVAGPDGGTEEKPVGLVYIGFMRRGEPARAMSCQFKGDRAAVRHQSVLQALELAEQLMRGETPVGE